MLSIQFISPKACLIWFSARPLFPGLLLCFLRERWRSKPKQILRRVKRAEMGLIFGNSSWQIWHLVNNPMSSMEIAWVPLTKDSWSIFIADNLFIYHHQRSLKIIWMIIKVNLNELLINNDKWARAACSVFGSFGVILMVEVVLGHVQVCRFTTYGEPILNRISKKFTIRVRVFLPDANLKTKLIAWYF